MKTCCFTGHRIIKVTPELTSRLRNTIIDLYKQGVTDFYNGLAIGWDMLCADTVIGLKTDYGDMKLHLLLPCPADEQIKGWNKAQIENYMRILQAADSVTVISEHYTDDCMKRRNEKLVELADCCVCYCNNRRSGTGQTMKMAENKGISIINLALEKIDLGKILLEIHQEKYAEFDNPPHHEPSLRHRVRMDKIIYGKIQTQNYTEEELRQIEKMGGR